MAQRLCQRQLMNKVRITLRKEKKENTPTWNLKLLAAIQEIQP